LAAILAWLVFLVCINTSIKVANLFKKSSKWPFSLMIIFRAEGKVVYVIQHM
jgi:hypothetical protein